MQAAKNMLGGLIHLFYPRLCEGCSKPLLAKEEVLCLSCYLQLPRTEYHNDQANETAVRFAGRVPFQYATSFAYFSNDGLLQHLLHGLKYKGKKEIGIYLGAQLGNDLKQADWVQDVDVIIPVPLHVKKQAKRGYNQSAVITEGMRNVLHIPFTEDVLHRVRNTDTQTKKTREERVDNMQEAFVVSDKDKLTGKHLLLIDDVLTTGATLEACANTLLGIDNVKVSIATVGIVV